MKISDILGQLDERFFPVSLKDAMKASSDIANFEVSLVVNNPFRITLEMATWGLHLEVPQLEHLVDVCKRATHDDFPTVAQFLDNLDDDDIPAEIEKLICSSSIGKMSSRDVAKMSQFEIELMLVREIPSLKGKEKLVAFELRAYAFAETQHRLKSMKK